MLTPLIKKKLLKFINLSISRLPSARLLGVGRKVILIRYNKDLNSAPLHSATPYANASGKFFLRKNSRGSTRAFNKLKVSKSKCYICRSLWRSRDSCKRFFSLEKKSRRVKITFLGRVVFNMRDLVAQDLFE